ncbi:Proteasome maturation factor UMP1 family-containing protein [Strongyloides ratti]|uniref:Proteasome maturation factor UMP1 family-containing protein n=1 Tax=Strongyloides ratti TaxID=34506 RepID=A0A090LGL2_STRRB|nr:Proteasome maturation factor UMP1 family-containing protein [Strongyloides ratti]CEF67243.1 Proteasome maturation factor UMP1 family-containing protein [Strongyloides ratti]
MSESVVSLSKRQPDLLKSQEDGPSTFTTAIHDNLHKGNSYMTEATRDSHMGNAPMSGNIPPHELLAKHSHMITTVEDMFNQRQNLLGSAFGEQFLREIDCASKVNRGPEGFSNSSRLHLDVLLGTDESINFCDYLNYEYHLRG